MKYYRIVYLKNRIISCNETDEKAGDEPVYEQNNGQLSFAIIRAQNESQARSVAKYRALELQQQQTQTGT